MLPTELGLVAFGDILKDGRPPKPAGLVTSRVGTVGGECTGTPELYPHAMPPFIFIPPPACPDVLPRGEPSLFYTSRDGRTAPFTGPSAKRS